MAEGNVNRLRRGLPVRACGVILAVALVDTGAVLMISVANAAPATHVVTIEGMSFNPQSLTVHIGDRVVWVNKDLFPHTATADTRTFDSGSIAPDASWTFVAGKAGDYAYRCTFHPTMKGKLMVQ